MRYKPTIKSVKKHPLPEWFKDAKLGIFVHWGLYSVPAYAPKRNIIDNLREGGWRYHFQNNPYAEWYMNSMDIEGSDPWRYHRKRYGKDFDYKDFVQPFTESVKKWDPDRWASLFEKSGAEYVVAGAKHHDGFLLFNSSKAEPVIQGWHTHRDVIGELADSVRSRDMRYGVYYSSALDWSFNPGPIRDMADLLTNGPTDRSYLDYVWNHWLEIIERYEPDVLWSDIGFPPGRDLSELFSIYYNTVPHGVVNDRWKQIPAPVQWMFRRYPVRKLINHFAKKMWVDGKLTTMAPPHYDYVTPEYSSFDEIAEEKWECVRGIGTSFGYNSMETAEDYMSSDELVHLLVDIVSKNGNLMINVGPDGSGHIPNEQKKVLLDLGDWLDKNGEAIFGSRPWITPGTSTPEGMKIRYTSKKDTVYATILDPKPGKQVTLKNLRDRSNISILGSDVSPEDHRTGSSLKIKIPEALEKTPACVFRLE